MSVKLLTAALTAILSVQPKKVGRPTNKGKSVYLKAETLAAIGLSHTATADEINQVIKELIKTREK